MFEFCVLNFFFFLVRKQSIQQSTHVSIFQSTNSMYENTLHESQMINERITLRRLSESRMLLFLIDLWPGQRQRLVAKTYRTFCFVGTNDIDDDNDNDEIHGSTAQTQWQSLRVALFTLTLITYTIFSTTSTIFVWRIFILMPSINFSQSFHIEANTTPVHRRLAVQLYMCTCLRLYAYRLCTMST